MRLTSQLLDQRDAIFVRVMNLNMLNFSNYPESRNFVLRSHYHELIGHKHRLEEIMEQTTNKEWLIILVFNEHCHSDYDLPGILSDQ